MATAAATTAGWSITRVPENINANLFDKCFLQHTHTHARTHLLPLPGAISLPRLDFRQGEMAAVRKRLELALFECTQRHLEADRDAAAIVPEVAE